MTTNLPWLLILGGAWPEQGLRCVKQAKDRGMRVWLTDTAENLVQAPDIAAAADRVTPLNYQDPVACVAWALAQAQNEAFLGVFGFREYSVEAVAQVAQALNLPGNPPEAVRRVRNKAACREELRKQGFRQPAVAICSNLEDAGSFVAAHPSGPWVMKPLASMGSQGVSLIKDDTGWEAAFAHLGALNHQQFLVEEFQSGSEFSAEGVFVAGQPHVLTLTSKMTSGAPHFVELGHTMPAYLDSTVRETIEHTVVTALRSLGLVWGNFHVEFWLADDAPVLGEVHVRPGGDYIHWMTELVTNVQVPGTIFDQLLERAVDPTQWRPRRGAAICFLTLPPGRITAIRGWEDVIADPRCVLARFKLNVGDLISPIRSWVDRPGFILGVGETNHMAAQIVEDLCRKVQVDIAMEQHDAQQI